MCTRPRKPVRNASAALIARAALPVQAAQEIAAAAAESAGMPAMLNDPLATLESNATLGAVPSGMALFRTHFQAAA